MTKQYILATMLISALEAVGSKGVWTVKPQPLAIENR
jgi:hypothetical protein